MGNDKKKILVIDDEAVFRDAMYESMIKCGYSCIAVDNPADGVKRIKTTHFDLILLDIMMDPFDGWDTLEHISRLPEAHNVPVIMASAKTLMIDEAIRFGDLVAGFLKKPFESSEFCEEVSLYLTWYTTLLSGANLAESAGISREICDQYIRLSRQIRGMKGLRDVVSPRFLPSYEDDGESRYQEGIREFDEGIMRKTQELKKMQAISQYFVI